jgi:hypothetical protein
MRSMHAATAPRDCWYAQGWDVALADRGVIYNVGGVVNFQPHHQLYNYFAKYAPGTELRERHLKGMKAFWQAAANGTLPNGSGRVAGIDRRNNSAPDRLELEVRKGSSPP